MEQENDTPQAYHARMQEKEKRQLAALERSIERMQQGIRLYCFELKYGKISQN
jgi:Na+/phosphate symporter